jgi:hypothetical protein
LDAIRATVADELRPVKTALAFALYSALDPWEHIISLDTQVVVNRSLNHLASVSNYYGTGRHHYCMFLGAATHCDIICSYIWPQHTAGEGLEVFGLEKGCVDDPRNFLRLHKSLEKAFDRKRIIFDCVPATTAGEFKLQLNILDPDFRNDAISYNNSTVFGSDLDNTQSHYIFREDRLPFRRLLSMHIQKAITNAKARGWILDEADGAALRERAIQLARLSLEPQQMAFLFPTI